MQHTQLIFPQVTDQEYENCTLFIVQIEDYFTYPLPNFMILSNDFTKLDINPIHANQLGSYTLLSTLLDLSGGESQYQFVITVTNQAPVVTGTIPLQVNVTFGQNLMYNLPLSYDPENLPYTTSITYGPQYASIISNAVMRLNPTDCQKDFGYQEVYIKLQDQEPRSFFYSIGLFVDNKPPIFSSSLPQNQTMILNTIFSYQLPYFYDPEGCPVIVTFEPRSLSSIVSVKGDKLIFSPNQQYHVRDFEITVFLSDYQNLSSNATFWLTVYGPQKFIEPIPKKIDLMGSNPTSYSLPIIPEIVGQFIVHLTKLPSFAQFNFPTYQFFPSKSSDLGQHKIKGQLWNTHTYQNYSFILNVTNSPPFFIENQLLKEQEILINTTEKYQLPKAQDREGHSIRYSTYAASSSSLPQFVRFNSTSLVYTFSPTYLDVADVYTIKIDLFDTFDAVSSYKFKLVLKDSIFSTGSKSNIQNYAQNNSYKASDLKAGAITFVNMTFTKITRDQIAIISIYNLPKTGGIQQILQQISNNSFKAILKQQDAQSIIPYEIIAKETVKCQVYIKLSYPDISNISVSQTPDSLQIINLNRISAMGKQNKLIFLENTFTESSIPPQLTSEIEKKVASLFKGGRFTFTKITPFNIFIGILFQLIWSQLEDFSFLTIITLIAIPIPGLPSTIQRVILKLIYFDILYCELWLPQLMVTIGLDIEEEIDNDNALSLEFDETGLSFKQFLKNAGSSLLYIFFYIFAWISLLLLQRFSSLFPRLLPFKSKIESLLMWNQSLGLLLSQFTPLFLCSIINFTDIRFKNNEKVPFSSTIFSIAVLALMGAAQIGIFSKIYQLQRNLNDTSRKEFNEKFSKLTEGLNSSGGKLSIYYWKPLTLIRWAFTLVILVALNDFPALQMLLLIIFSIAYQSLILIFRPFETSSLNWLSFINELAVTIYLYLTLMMSDFMYSQVTDSSIIAQIRILLAWSIVILLMCIIFINCVYTYSGYAYSLFQNFKRRINQIRYKDRVIRLKPTRNHTEKPIEKLNADTKIQRRKQIVDNERIASSNQYQFTFEETSTYKEKNNDSTTKIMPETSSKSNLHFDRRPEKF